MAKNLQDVKDNYPEAHGPELDKLISTAGAGAAIVGLAVGAPVAAGLGAVAVCLGGVWHVLKKLSGE